MVLWGLPLTHGNGRKVRFLFQESNTMQMGLIVEVCVADGGLVIG